MTALKATRLWSGCRQPLAPGRGRLGLLAWGQTCSAQVGPGWPTPLLIDCREALVHRCPCLSSAPDPYCSRPKGSRRVVTIHTSWDSSPCILNPTTENKKSARCLNVLVRVEHSCSADLNGAIHTLTARRALKYVAESALMRALKYNSDFCNQGQCQALVHLCLESRY